MGDVDDIPTLLGGLAPDAEVHLLDPSQNGLAQVAALLAGRAGISALHIVSHGAAGSLSLGALTLDIGNLDWYQRECMTIGAALAPGANILLYGCNVAADDGEFAAAFAAACGAEVAASRTPVGAAALSGNWELEHKTGVITASLPFSAAARESYAGVLAISDGQQILSGFTAQPDGSATNGNWTVSAKNGNTADDNTVIVDEFGGFIDDQTKLTAPVSSYLEIKLSNTGSFILTGAEIGDYTPDNSSAANNFTNVYVAGYANNVQVATTTAHSSVGNYEPDYHFDFSPFAGQLIDTFRIYYTASTNDEQIYFNFVNFTISAYSNTAPVVNTAPAFVGTNTPLVLAQNGTAIPLASLLHASDTDSSQTLTWSQSSAPSHGTLIISGATAGSGGTDIAPAGTITYAPSAGYAGMDSFAVQVSDGTSVDTRVITVSVAPATPGAPVLSAASDSGSSASDHITNSTTLSFSGSGAAADSSSTVRVFVDINGNGSYDAGTDASSSHAMDNGSWTVSDLSISSVADGTYHVYAVTTSADGSLSSANSAALDITIDKTAPTVSFSNVTLSADTGSSASDFITATAAQTISATLSAVPGAGETVYGSLDNGSTWTDLSAMVSGTVLTWTGVTLSSSNTLKLRVVDTAGNASAAASFAYTLDTAAPAAPSALALDPASDSGASNSDAVTSIATPVVNGSGENGATVTLYDSNGSTVLGTATVSGGQWSISTSTLGEGAHALSATQTDAAGNTSAVSSALVIEIDTTAPSTLALSASTVLKADATAGAALATVSASDTHDVVYSLAVGSGGNDADNGLFTMAGNVLKPVSSLEAGTYHVYLAATDTAGNAGAQAFTITVTDAPSVSSIVRGGGAAGAVPASSTSIDYTITFDQNVTGVDASDFALTASGTASGEIAAVSGSGSTYTVTVNNLGGDGTLRLDLNASGTGIQNGSSAAISGGYSSGQAYTLDHTAPGAPAGLSVDAASDSGSSSSDHISNVGTPVISGTSEANAAITLYDTDGSTVLGTGTADGLGHWSITSGTLGAGSHTLSATATDAAGNTSGASGGLTYELDTAAPASVAVSGTLVSTLQAANGATVATLSASDAHSVQYALSAGSGGSDADNGSFSISGNSLVAAANLAAGTYHVHLTATDAAGNSADQSFAIDVVDLPVVSSIVRAGGASAMTPAGATSVDYTVTFSQDVTGVDASDFALAVTGTAAGTIASVSGSGSTYTVTVNDIAGDGSLRLDLNGSGTGIHNTSSIAIGSGFTSGQAYALDHTAPAAPSAPAMASASDTGSSGSDQITRSTTPVFTGTGEANATVKLYDTDGTTVVGTTSADSAGNWSITSSALGEGTHTLTVTQADAAGNVSGSSSPLTVVIDTVAAAPAMPALDAGSDSGAQGDRITSRATPTVSGTAEANASVSLYDTDGTTVLGTTVVDSSGKWSITSSTLSDGGHTLSVKQTDVAGNTSLASDGLALTIDSTAPAAPGAPVLSPATDTGLLGDHTTENRTVILTGTAEANAAIKLFDTDGVTVVGSATADADGHWSITTSVLSLGVHTLTAKAADAAGNVSPVSTALALTIEAPPAITIDGMQVSQQNVTLPGGASGILTTIPIVDAGRVESSGTANVADIPLVANGGTSVLTAQLPQGFGLTAAGGASQPAGNSLDQLISSIIAATPGHPAADQGHLTGNGTNFLKALPQSAPLLVQTITPQSVGAPTAPLTLTGTSTDQQHTALVVDGAKLAPGSQLVLNNVDFAAIIGTMSVTGNTNGQTLTGDAASQQFSVASGSASAVFSGGGDDVLKLNSAGSPAGAAPAANVQASGTTLLHGGQGNDLAVFSGASDDYTVEYHDGYEIVTAKAQPEQHTLVVNAEALQFSDATLTVENRAPLTVITSLYQSILGRQGDYLGVEVWATAQKNGESLGKIALDIINSAEAQQHHPVLFTGNSSSDVELLYQTIFGRDSDAQGLAFWVDKMDHGLSLEQVADYFIAAHEMEVHKIGAQNWDFLV